MEGSRESGVGSKEKVVEEKLMSQFHFSHLFKQSLGVSPHQYILQQQVERAQQLLKQTKLSVVEIALQSGFNSHSHMSQQFRQLTGMTPKAYRAG